MPKDVLKELRAAPAVLSNLGPPATRVMRDAADDEIERLRAAMTEACALLAERTYGSPARSPGHNARLRLEDALRFEAEKSTM